MNIIPTAQSLRLTMLQRFGKAYTTDSYTTINQKLAIRATATIDVTKQHKLNLVIIGNGGHHYTTSPGPVTDYHVSTNTGLYSQIPIVMRKTNADLTPTQREKYALRKSLTVGSTTYYAYYAKRIDLSIYPIANQIKTINTSGVVTNTVNYVPTSSELSPTPLVMGSVATTDKKYVGSYLTMTDFIFDEMDIAEIQNTATILYGSISNAIVSEIGFCASQDANISITNYDGSTSTFTEADHTLLTDVSDGEFYNLATGVVSVNSSIVFGCTTDVKLATL